MKNITIMGSTGSIGTQALDIVRNNPELKVIGLGAGNNIDLLEKQIREFKPLYASVIDKEHADDLKERLADIDIKIGYGMDGLVELASMKDSQLFLTAIVGMKGIRPTIAAIEAGTDIALANKETLVTAGHIIIPLAKEKGVRIIPVDSEHSAIYQCLLGCKPQDDGKLPIKNIWLTASGGPFLGRTKEELSSVTLKDALAHPNWSMGTKVTIDSASMVNKGLEVIEAKWLFGTDIDQIKVIIQPKSIIHSMVEFKDGGFLAQLGVPDMHLPIAFALLDGERKYIDDNELDFTKLTEISFRIPDNDTFKGLPLAIRAAKENGSMPTVFNAANEMAVRMFVKEKITFLQIYEIIENAMNDHKVIASPTLDDILSIEQETYRLIESGKYI